MVQTVEVKLRKQNIRRT